MTARVTGGSLNLREGTSTSAPVLLILPDGMVVDILTPGPEWTKVIVKDPDDESTEGYVMTRYLAMPTAAVPEPKAAAKPKKKAAAKKK